MTLTQKQDLEIYKDTGELKDSIKNLFIEHCLEELIENEKTLRNYNSTTNFWLDCRIDDNLACFFILGLDGGYYEEFDNLHDHFKKLIILTFLSRTQATLKYPIGQAVIPFLDVKTNVDNPLQYATEHSVVYKTKNKISFFYDFIAEEIQKTKRNYAKYSLRHLLLKNFTDVCFHDGEGFEKSLKIINKIYINHL